MSKAVFEKERYLIQAPELVGDPSALLTKIWGAAEQDTMVLMGFDFPIGLPARYAKLAGIENFLSLLPRLGEQEWANFYNVAECPDQIDLHRPFYPQRPGGTAMRHLIDGLGVQSADDLLRGCDRGYPGRPAAAPIFWTMGAKQVGKATISGWRDLLAPALRSRHMNVMVWPFDGELHDLLQPRRTVITETYPAEFYRHLGIGLGSKRDQEDRRANAAGLLEWVERASVGLTPDMSAAIQDGFGPSDVGEDKFDAAIGLLGMLNVILGYRPPGEPTNDNTRRLEGWMLGQLATRSDERTANVPKHSTGQGTTVAALSAPTEYDPLADLYDLEYVHDHDVPFWLALAGREAGPVVEWGAGTGRIAAPLAAAGHDVTAVEVSENMVAKGRKKSADAAWVPGDMRTANPEGRYGLAICAFNSFLCLPSMDDALTFLRNAREYLRPGGLLGVEVSVLSPDELVDPPGGPALRHDLSRDLPDGGGLDRFSLSRYDPATQLMEMRLFYELHDASGETTGRRAHDLVIRLVGRAELELMLRLAGFEVEAVYGGFDGEAFDAASDHLLVLARRPGERQ